MKPDEQDNRLDEGLPPIIEKIETDISGWLRANPYALRTFIAGAAVLVLSPMAVFWLRCHEEGKDWSELVKNVVESGAVLAAVFVVIKWVNERRDRATDVLIKLEERFEHMDDGKDILAAGDFRGSADEVNKIDALLRFYVVLYGILLAKQIPEKSLSICFRYWLGHYFRKDRTKFREFVDEHYPTLHAWLRSDAKQNCRFFRPKRLFNDKTDDDFIKACAKEGDN